MLNGIITAIPVERRRSVPGTSEGSGQISEGSHGWWDGGQQKSEELDRRTAGTFLTDNTRAETLPRSRPHGHVVVTARHQSKSKVGSLRQRKHPAQRNPLDTTFEPHNALQRRAEWHR